MKTKAVGLRQLLYGDTLGTDQFRVAAVGRGEYRGFDTDTPESDQRLRCRTRIKGTDCE